MAKRTSTPRSGATKPKNQRASARGAAPERDDDEGIGDEADGVEFDPDKFLAHVENLATLKSKGAEIRGQIGAAVKGAEEDYGIDRWATKISLALKAMTEENRRARLKSLRDQFTALGWGEMDDLFASATPADRATFAGRGASN